MTGVSSLMAFAVLIGILVYTLIPRKTIVMGYAVDISTDGGESFSSLYEYETEAEAVEEVARFTKIAMETGNGNIYVLRKLEV